MRNVILTFLLHATLLWGQQEALVSGGESPNHQYQVVLIEPQDESAQPSAFFRHIPSGKIIGEHFVGSYANYSAAKDPVNTEVLWSPDSKFAALKSRTRKRTGETDIFQVSPKGIRQIKPTDYVHSIVSELGSKEINRYCYDTPSRWITPKGLVIDVTGDCIVGPRDTGIWRAFHYEVCIRASNGKTKWMKRLELTNEEG